MAVTPTDLSPTTTTSSASHAIEPVAGAGAQSPLGQAHAPASHEPKRLSRSALAKLTLGALGVVYGDIGTSPLYAIKECFNGPHGIAPSVPNVLGVLSLVFWSLTLVIAVKYLGFIMRADNRGEGGILALLALAVPKDAAPKMGVSVLVTLGLFGTALLYGDGIITPAISVLSAIEGLEVATPVFRPAVIPITIAILLALFLAQRRGTAGIGAVFGPTTFVWFLCIAGTGLPWIIRHPAVLRAVNPIHALDFFVRNHGHGFLVLGAVFLVVTGGEALYADMGHFGKRPIRFAWIGMVMPALLINYFGQGALLMSRAGAGSTNPFYELVGGWMTYPLVVISTAATVVASQAMISGAFSMTRQAVQLGYCPRVNVIHTSGDAEGQIFVPEVNWALMVACIALVIGFKESTNLAAAYGIAVTATMSITSVLFFAVARYRWNWSAWRAGGLVAVFLVVDLAFLGANAAKIAHGGWFPLVVGAGVFTLMLTWKRGRAELGKAVAAAHFPLDTFLEEVAREKPHRVKGTAVFMTQNLVGTPIVLLHHFKHNQVLHAHVILLTVVTEHLPEVPPAARVDIIDKGQGFYLVVAHYGFMQAPNVPEILSRCAERGLGTVHGQTSFYLGRETLLTSGPATLARWRKALFVIMSRNARPATAFFGIPPGRVVELGTQIEL